MKLLSILSLALLSRAFAETQIRSGRVKGQTDSDSELEGGIEQYQRKRDLASKSGSKGSCVKYEVYYDNDEFKDTFEGGDGTLVGTNGPVPIYFTHNDKKAGTYMEVTTAVGEKDCYFTGIYTWAVDNSDRPTTQTFIGGTCYAKSQAVFGGTGAYKCSSGFVSLVKKGSRQKKHRIVYICQDACY